MPIGLYGGLQAHSNQSTVTALWQASRPPCSSHTPLEPLTPTPTHAPTFA